nr:sensor histidine kinase [uncultured Cellulosilyticum sp.]
MKRLEILNSCKIKHKLVIIYIFCVCIPMLVTDSVIVLSIKNDALERQAITMENMMERIKYNIRADMAGCTSIASNLYTDETINKFLSTDHQSNLEYYERYKQLIQNNMLKYYYNSQRINNIMLYADNPTIINGGNFWKVEDIKESQWYKKFKESGQDTLWVTYYSEQNKFTSRMNRIISLISKLNYNGSKGRERFVKIDLEYNGIFNDILNEKVDGEIYICNDEYILFSNKTSENSLKPFKSRDELPSKALTYKETFNVGEDEWTIYIMPEAAEVWPMLQDSRGMVWLLIIINLLLPTCIISIVSKSFTGRIKLIEEYLDKVKREEFEVITESGGNDEIGALIKSYNLMVTKIKDLIETIIRKNAEKQALELARKNAELKALQSQVNPHFMFNTLESIRMRSLLKNENETAEIIGQLSIILRKSLSWKDDNISVEEEMTFVKQYTNIQKYRFGEKLSFGTYIMPECSKLRIPKLSILTFVENACVHGIEEISSSGNVFVAVSKDEENLYIEISDSGCGMNEQELQEIRARLESLDINKLSESKSTGMLNALIRMNLYCEGNLQFQIDSELGQGTDIMLQMPLDKIS